MNNPADTAAVLPADALTYAFTYCASPTEILTTYSLVHSSWYALTHDPSFLQRLIQREHIPQTFIKQFRVLRTVEREKDEHVQFIVNDTVCMKRAICLWSLFSAHFCSMEQSSQPMTVNGDENKRRGGGGGGGGGSDDDIDDSESLRGKSFFVQWRVWMHERSERGDNYSYQVSPKGARIPATLEPELTHTETQCRLNLKFGEALIQQWIGQYHRLMMMMQQQKQQNNHTVDLFEHSKTIIGYFLKAQSLRQQGRYVLPGLALPNFIAIQGYATVRDVARDGGDTGDDDDVTIVDVEVMSFEWVEQLSTGIKDFKLSDITYLSDFMFYQRFCGRRVTNVHNKCKLLVKSKLFAYAQSPCEFSAVEHKNSTNVVLFRYPVSHGQESIWTTKLLPFKLLCNRDSLFYSGVLTSRNTVLLRELRLRRPAFDWRLFTNMTSREQLYLLGNAFVSGSIMTGFIWYYLVPYLRTHTLDELQLLIQQDLLRTTLKMQTVNLMYSLVAFGPMALAQSYLSQKMASSGFIQPSFVSPFNRIQRVMAQTGFSIWVYRVITEKDQSWLARWARPWLTEWYPYYIKSKIFILGVECLMRLMPYSFSFSFSILKHAARRGYMLFVRLKHGSMTGGVPRKEKDKQLEG